VKGKHVSEQERHTQAVVNTDMAASMKRIQAFMDQQQREAGPKPHHFNKPPYGTSEYRHAHACGWISDGEAEGDQKAYLARRERAKASYGRPSKPDPRQDRPAPPESRQYMRPMATKVLRDDRLTPQAKAALGVVLAFCGKGHHCDTTKSFLANRMSRSTRSILRYLTALTKLGYIKTKTRRNAKGMDIGLRIWITNQVLPFFAKDGPLAAWLAETTNFTRKQGKTDMSPNNDPSKILFLFPPSPRQRQPQYSP
jgi:hypothetical protein